MIFLKNKLVQRAANAAKFYKKRLYVFGAFSIIYTSILYRYRKHNNEIFRMALAGSLSNMI